VCAVLQARSRVEAGWVLAFLESPHADVRERGWAWFEEAPEVREDVRLWQRLLRSPHDDVRRRLLKFLERRGEGQPGAPEDVLMLGPDSPPATWARALWALHSGGRAGARLVGPLVRHLQQHPNELPRALPVLAAALRSVRGPAWRDSLATLVRWAGDDPERTRLVREVIPEPRAPRLNS
jgi:hypothetical protein